LVATPFVVLLAGIAVLRVVHIDERPHSRNGDACGQFGQTAIIGFDLRTGKQRWSNIVGTTANQLEVAHHEIRVTGDDRVRALDPRSGDVVRCRVTPAVQIVKGPQDDSTQIAGRSVMNWGDGVRSVPTEGKAWGYPHAGLIGAVGDDVLVSTNRQPDHAPGIALADGATGRPIWSRPELVPLRAPLTEPILLVGIDERTVGAISPRDGHEVWRRRLPRPFASDTLAITGGVVVVAQGEGADITVLDESTGRVRWHTNAGNPAMYRNNSRSSPFESAVALPSANILVVTVTAYDPDNY
jgi:outer membrane protein assembly factor BamB